jgi:hypothetical protein
MPGNKKPRKNKASFGTSKKLIQGKWSNPKGRNPAPKKPVKKVGTLEVAVPEVTAGT